MTSPGPKSSDLARLPRGLQDRGPAEIRAAARMIAAIAAVYERYGFEPLETPAFEYTDALGKFLPDTDRPNAGVFSWTDDDDATPSRSGAEAQRTPSRSGAESQRTPSRSGAEAQRWLSLRYDLTAPLARYVAQNIATLPKPFRRYATGPVWRNEKPGPGRFRQFIQCDADTVGSESIAADAEMCMLICDVLEAIGIPRGGYVVKVSNRKVLDGLMQAIGLGGEVHAGRRLGVLRAIDKFDRLGAAGVRALLGPGRQDLSGDFTKGAGLDDQQIDGLMMLFDTAGAKPGSDGQLGIPPTLTGQWHSVESAAGLAELTAILELAATAGYGTDRILIDVSIVRGLEYYTGPVFEAELTTPIFDANGQPVRLGAVASGGRYDGLIARFTGETVPATGCSIGVSRLQAALDLMHPDSAPASAGPVVVLVMDKGPAELASYLKIVAELRAAGIPAELYLGSAGMKAQMKYADKRGSPVVVIEGGNERANGEVTLKDLIEGAKAAHSIKDNKDWKAARPAQVTVPRDQLVAEVRTILARHGGGG